MNYMGPVAAFLASILWSLAVDIYSDLARKYSPSTINSTRAIIALPFFAIFFVLENIHAGIDLGKAFEVALDPQMLLWLTLSCLGSYALGDLVFMRSTLSPLGVAGALSVASVYPMWSALAGWIFKGQMLKPIGWIGLLIVIAGTIGVIRASQKAADATSSAAVRRAGRVAAGMGAMLALLSSVFWTVNAYSISQTHEISSALANIFRLLIALVLCPLFGFIFLGSRQWIMDRADIKKALPILILEGFGGSLFYIYAMAHTPLALGSVLTSLAPVLAVPIGYLRHGHIPSRQKVFAVCVVMLGLWLLATL